MMTAGSAGTPARLQIAYDFPPGAPGNDNARYLDLSPETQRFARSEIGVHVNQWFPVVVRDEWLALQIETLPGGTYRHTDALTLMNFKVQDPRITQTGLGVDPNTIEISYNIHDDVQCSSIKADLYTGSVSAKLTVQITVQDPALPSGTGTLVARIQLELKWEVTLGDVILP